MLAALVCLGAAWALVSLAWPPGFDHGLFAWTGDVVTRGGFMYRDAWDMHGPLVPYLFAVPQWVLGRHFWGVRLLDLLFLALGTVALWQLVARTGPAPSRRAAWWAATLYALTYASLGYDHTAQPDGWVSLVSAAVFAPLLTARRPRTTHLVIAGLAIGCFTMVKPFFVLLGLVPLVYLTLNARQSSLGVPDPGVGMPSGPLAVGLRSAATLGAAAAVPMLVLFWYYHRGGALDALLDVHLRYTTRVYNDGLTLHLRDRLRGLQNFLLNGHVVSIALAAAASGAVLLWRSRASSLLAAVATWLGLAIFFALLQNKYYFYHWVPSLLPIALLAAYGLSSATQRGIAREVSVLGSLTIAVIALHAAVRPTMAVGRGVKVALGLSSTEVYMQSFAAGGALTPLRQQLVAQYIRSHPLVDGGVAIWGTDAGILYLSGVPTTFRLAGWFWPVVNGPGTAVQREYVQEYLEALRAQAPALLIVNREEGERHPQYKLEHYPEVAAAIAARYVHDSTVGPFEVLKRTDDIDRER